MLLMENVLILPLQYECLIISYYIFGVYRQKFKISLNLKKLNGNIWLGPINKIPSIILLQYTILAN